VAPRFFPSPELTGYIMDYLTFREKKEKESGRYIDRQNTKWEKEIKDKCDHEWQPLNIHIKEHGQPDMNNAKVWCVCMKCCSHTYIKTAWVGFYIGSPDLLEEPEE
jgi:hypothetical protein